VTAARVARFILVVFAAAAFFAMLQLITILNRCHHFRGFVYQHACFGSDQKSIEIARQQVAVFKLNGNGRG
jgi:hypothetical protein